MTGNALKDIEQIEASLWEAADQLRSNFFDTRTVPCELWHLDRGKPRERRDQVLMIDARNTK